MLNWLKGMRGKLIRVTLAGSEPEPIHVDGELKMLDEVGLVVLVGEKKDELGMPFAAIRSIVAIL